MNRDRPQGGDVSHLGLGTPVPVGSVVLGSAGGVEDERPAWLFALHEARRRGADLVVLHACGQGRSHAEPTWADERALEHGRRLGGRVAFEARRASPVATRTVGVCPSLGPVDALLAASRPAPLLVLQGHRPLHPLLPSGRGRTVRAVAARADCPVVAVPDTWSGSGRHGVVVGVDDHGRSRNAVRVALDDAEATGDAVTAVHAWDVWGTAEAPPTHDELEIARDSAQRLLSEALAGLQADHPTVELRGEVVRGWPVDVLAEAARRARLLVVARHTSSRTGLLALGRTARGLLARASCPVGVTPPTVERSRGRRLLDDVPVGPGS